MAPISPQEAADPNNFSHEILAKIKQLMKTIDNELLDSYTDSTNQFKYSLSNYQLATLRSSKKAFPCLQGQYKKVGWKTIELKDPLGCGAYIEFTPGNE